MHTFKKINKKSKRGQAVIEYILLLIIGVAITLGLSSQFSTPFKNFMGSLISGNGYYACLFETASLPGNPSSQCDYSDFQEGSNDWGLQFNSSGSSGGSSYTPPSTNTNSSSHSSNSSSVQEWGNANSEFTDAGGRSSGGSQSFSSNTSSSGRSSRGGSQSFLANNSRAGRKGLFGKNDNSLSSTTNSDSFKINSRKKRFKARSKLTPAGRGFLEGDSRGGAGSGIISQANLSQEQENQLNRQSSFSAGAAKKSSNGQDPQTKSFVMSDPPKKQDGMEEDEPFTFGKFIKYIMLGVILLTILFFIGSKAMEISENLNAA